MSQPCVASEAPAEAENMLSTELSRRRFLGTSVMSSALRVSGVQALSQAVPVVTNAVAPVVIERVVPKFLSPLSIARMQQLFGNKADTMLGKPLQEAMPLFLDHKARERFPVRILQWSIERESLDSGLRILQEIQKRNIRHRIASESPDAWFQDMVQKISEEPETSAIVESCLGECVALDIHERAFPAIAGDIERMMQRKNLQRLHRGEGPMELKYTPQIGIDAVVRALCNSDSENMDERYKIMHRAFLSEDSMQNAALTLSNDPETKRVFIEDLSRIIDECASNMASLAVKVQQLESEYELRMRNEFAKEETVKSSKERVGLENVSTIVESIQQPFHRLIAQIHILANQDLRSKLKHDVLATRPELKQ